MKNVYRKRSSSGPHFNKDCRVNLLPQAGTRKDAARREACRRQQTPARSVCRDQPSQLPKNFHRQGGRLSRVYRKNAEARRFHAAGANTRIDFQTVSVIGP